MSTELPTLLPPNATALEQALARTGATALERLDPALITALWNPATCPIHALPWLAWALSVDDWDDGWPEAVKRAVVAASIPVHRRKGTVASVRTAIAALGVPAGEIALDERLAGRSWADYGITLQQPFTLALAAAIRRAVAHVAPARSRLVYIRPVVPLRHNGVITRRDGTYCRGTLSIET